MHSSEASSSRLPPSSRSYAPVEDAAQLAFGGGFAGSSSSTPNWTLDHPPPIPPCSQPPQGGRPRRPEGSRGRGRGGSIRTRGRGASTGACDWGAFTGPRGRGGAAPRGRGRGKRAVHGPMLAQDFSRPPIIGAARTTLPPTQSARSSHVARSSDISRPHQGRIKGAGPPRDPRDQNDRVPPHKRRKPSDGKPPKRNWDKGTSIEDLEADRVDFRALELAGYSHAVLSQKSSRQRRLKANAADIARAQQEAGGDPIRMETLMREYNAFRTKCFRCARLELQGYPKEVCDVSLSEKERTRLIKEDDDRRRDQRQREDFVRREAAERKDAHPQQQPQTAQQDPHSPEVSRLTSTLVELRHSPAPNAPSSPPSTSVPLSSSPRSSPFPTASPHAALTTSSSLQRRSVHSDAGEEMEDASSLSEYEVGPIPHSPEPTEKVGDDMHDIVSIPSSSPEPVEVRRTETIGKRKRKIRSSSPELDGGPDGAPEDANANSIQNADADQNKGPEEDAGPSDGPFFECLLEEATAAASAQDTPTERPCIATSVPALSSRSQPSQCHPEITSITSPPSSAGEQVVDRPCASRSVSDVSVGDQASTQFNTPAPSATNGTSSNFEVKNEATDAACIASRAPDSTGTGTHGSIHLDAPPVSSTESRSSSRFITPPPADLPHPPEMAQVKKEAVDMVGPSIAHEAETEDRGADWFDRHSQSTSSENPRSSRYTRSPHSARTTVKAEVGSATSTSEPAPGLHSDDVSNTTNFGPVGGLIPPGTAVSAVGHGDLTVNTSQKPASSIPQVFHPENLSHSIGLLWRNARFMVPLQRAPLTDKTTPSQFDSLIVAQPKGKMGHAQPDWCSFDSLDALPGNRTDNFRLRDFRRLTSKAAVLGVSTGVRVEPEQPFQAAIVFAGGQRRDEGPFVHVLDNRPHQMGVTCVSGFLKGDEDLSFVTGGNDSKINYWSWRSTRSEGGSLNSRASTVALHNLHQGQPLAAVEVMPSSHAQGHTDHDNGTASTTRTLLSASTAPNPGSRLTRLVGWDIHANQEQFNWSLSDRYSRLLRTPKVDMFIATCLRADAEKIKLWDLRRGKVPVRAFGWGSPITPSHIPRGAFHPSRTMLYAQGCEDGHVRVFDLRKPLVPVYDLHTPFPGSYYSDVVWHGDHVLGLQSNAVHFYPVAI